MPTAFRAALALALLLGTAVPLAARPVSPAERTALEETVGRFDKAMTANDMAAISATVPPGIMEFIAKSAGMSVEDLRKVMVEQMGQAMKDVKIVSFGMDTAKARTEELPDGTPYLLIPTDTVVDPGSGEAVTVHSDTLALLDGGQWFLLRVSDANQVSILKQVYPGFADVTFPGSTTTPNSQSGTVKP